MENQITNLQAEITVAHKAYVEAQNQFTLLNQKLMLQKFKNCDIQNFEWQLKVQIEMDRNSTRKFRLVADHGYGNNDKLYTNFPNGAYINLSNNFNLHVHSRSCTISSFSTTSNIEDLQKIIKELGLKVYTDGLQNILKKTSREIRKFKS